MSTPPEKNVNSASLIIPNLTQKISTRTPKNCQPLLKKCHIYRNNLTPPDSTLSPEYFSSTRKFLKPPENFAIPPPPKKFLNPPDNLSTPPPPPRKNPPQKKFSTPPPKISQPPTKISQPLPKISQPLDNFSTPLENISIPLKKISTTKIQKNSVSANISIKKKKK